MWRDNGRGLCRDGGSEVGEVAVRSSFMGWRNSGAVVSDSRGAAGYFADDLALGWGVVDLWEPFARDMKALAVLLMMSANL